MKGNKSVLVFTPHPDDHVVCAGTLLKLKKKGYKIYEVLFTDGETGGMIGRSDYTEDDTRVKRNDEFDKASAILGTTEVFKLHLPNNGVCYSRELFFQLIEIIRKVRPAISLIPHPSDYHRDHREVADISQDVLKRSANSFQEKLGEKYRTPVVLHYRGLEPLDNANFMVDITDQFDEIVKIFDVYDSQMTERMRQYIFSLPSLLGYYMRTKYAESFEVPKNFPIYPCEVLGDLE